MQDPNGFLRKTSSVINRFSKKTFHDIKSEGTLFFNIVLIHLVVLKKSLKSQTTRATLSYEEVLPRVIMLHPAPMLNRL